MSPDEQKLLSALESIARSMKRTADATEHMAKQSERAADVATEMLTELRRQREDWVEKEKAKHAPVESPAEWYRRNGYELLPDGRVRYVGLSTAQVLGVDSASSSVANEGAPK